MIIQNNFPPLLYTWNIGEKIKISIYGKSFSNENEKIRDKLSISLNPIHLHQNLLRYFIGKFLTIIEDGCHTYIGNDTTGSYRLYYSNSGLISRDFDEFKYHFQLDAQVKVVSKRGYTHGNLTTRENVYKLLPCELICLTLDLKHFNFLFTQNISKYFHASMVFKNYYDFMLGKRIALAFSGGKDSTVLARSLLKIGFIPELYFMEFIPTEKINNIEFRKASSAAAMLGLQLNVVKISNDEYILRSADFKKIYESDCSREFIYVKIFLEKIREKNFEILITGQNADTFVNFGVTRSTHPIDTFLLYIYKVVFKKIFYGNQLNILDLLISKWVYLSRKIDFNKFPKNLFQLRVGLINEKFYIPRYSENIIACTMNRSTDYFEWMLEQKLFNHIAGNHSIVWSDSDTDFFTVIMPYSDPSFINFGLNQMSLMSNILSPKKSIKP
jgi:hypothetical protein